MEIVSDVRFILSVGQDQNKYKKYYNDLIEYCRKLYPGRDKSKYPTVYLEEHHILPKCLGGQDEENNLVLMDYRSHVIAHCLLFLINQTNLSLAHAARCMLYLINSDSNDRSIGDIKDILDAAITIKEKILNFCRKPVVCLTFDSREVIRVYKGTLEISKDGFNPKVLSKTIKNKSTHKGYFWMRLEQVEKEYPEKLSKYYENLDNNILPDIKINDKNWISEQQSKYWRSKNHGKKVVGYDNEVYCVFNMIGDAVKLGFQYSTISNLINKIQNGKCGGYNWILYNELDNIVVDIIKSRTKVDKIFPKNSPRIICYDRDCDQIVRIYTMQKDTIKDGFLHTSVCSALSSNNHYYRGYYWYFETDFPKQHLIGGYNFNNIISITKKPINSAISVVRCDQDNNVLSEYCNLHSIPGYDFRAISRVISKENRYYKGYYWYTVEEFKKRYKYKYKEYEKRNKPSDNTR